MRVSASAMIAGAPGDLGLPVDQSDDARHGIPKTGRRGGEDVGPNPVHQHLRRPGSRLLVAVLFGDLGHPPVGRLVKGRADLEVPMPRWVVGGVADPEEDVAGPPLPAVVTLPRVLPTG